MVNVTVTTGGTSGPRGTGWLNGTGVPADVIGFDGDFYLDETTPNSPSYWGPKTTGTWVGHGPHTFSSGGSDVTSVTAADASIVVGGTGSAPTLRTGTLDVVATLEPPAANWSNNGHKIQSVANGTVSGDVVTFDQLPTTLPPNGSATGDLSGSYPAPTLAATTNVGTVAKTVLGTNNVPSSLGYTAWTSSVRDYSADQLAISGTIYLAAIDLYAAANLTTLVWHVGVLGATPTAGQNWVGLYDSTGTRRANVGVDSDISSTGRKTAAISYSAAVGRYYAAFLFNAATAPQMPRLSAGGARATFVNGALTGASLLFATNGTGTTLPTSITLSANVAGIGFFAALI